MAYVPDPKWADINKQGSGRPAPGDDRVSKEAQEAVDRANNASRLHQEANKLADRSPN
jgi:hypothetical protein